MVVQLDESLPRVFRVHDGIHKHKFKPYYSKIQFDVPVNSQKLIVEGFLSAPVLDGSRYVGFIDMFGMSSVTNGAINHTNSTLCPKFERIRRSPMFLGL